MKLSYPQLLAAAVVGVTALGASASAQILNGSFELNNGPGSTPLNWDFIPSAGSKFMGSQQTGWSSLNAKAGDWFEAFGASGSEDYLEQDVQDTPGKDYLLTYWWANNDPNTVLVTADETAEWNGVLVEGPMYVPSIPDGKQSFKYTEFTADVVGTGNDVLDLGGLNNVGWSALDYVRLLPVITAPGPAAFAPFAIGALAGIRRRARR
jgi:hypothetical protein